MAVTITAAEVASAIRLGNTAAELVEVSRLRDYAIVAVSRHLGDAFDDAPDAVANEATVRLVGYLFDQPYASRGTGLADAIRNSGAAAMLLPYRTHRAGTVGDAVAAAGTSPAAGVDRAAVEEIIRELVNPLGLIGNTDRWGAAKLPMPPNGAEAAAGTSTTIRSWTSALIRAAINAVVPEWARIGDTSTLPVPKLPPGELNNPVSLGTSADFDTLTTPGVYDFSPGTTYTNGPPLTDENHGTLIVFLARDDNMRVMQMVWGRGASSFPALYARVQRTATLWSGWFDAFAQGTGGAVRITSAGSAPDEGSGDTGRTEVHFRRDAVDAIAQVYFSADGSTAWTLVYDLYAIAGERIDAQVEPWARLNSDAALQIRPWESEDAYSPRNVVHHNAGLWFAPNNVIAAGADPGGTSRLWRMLATGDETVTISALSITPHNVAARQVILWVPSAGADPEPAIILRDGRFTGRQLAASATELLHIIGGDTGGVAGDESTYVFDLQAGTFVDTLIAVPASATLAYVYGRNVRWTRPSDDRRYEATPVLPIDLGTFRGLPARSVGDVIFDTTSTPQVIRGIEVEFPLDGFYATRDANNRILLGQISGSASSRWRGTFAVRFA